MESVSSRHQQRSTGHMQRSRECEAVVIGVSAGGLAALDAILPKLKRGLKAAVLVVQHISPDSENYLPVHFGVRCDVEVKEAEDKEPIMPGVVYFAPPDYHLMVECDKTIALSPDPKVNFSRPSIDVLFDTAAVTYNDSLAAVVLTGANSDGAVGLVRIKERGGLTIVQDPQEAEVDAMPRAALRAVDVDYILPLDKIAELLQSLG